MDMVSYIIPMYNSDKYIEKCINSIQKQTHKDIEIIVIDDGSYDDSLMTVKSLALTDNRISVYTQSNKGVAATRNRGMMLARGDFLQFVDADDYIAPQMTSNLLQKLKNENLDLCLCLLGYPGCNTPECKIDEFSESVEMIVIKYFKPLMKYNLLQGPCNKLYKTNIIRTNNILFPEKYSKLEDSIFNANYINHTNRIGLKFEQLYFYNQSISTSLSKIANMEEVNALVSFYKILLRKKNITEEYRQCILEYSIEQLEILYRVSWIQCVAKKTNYLEMWSVYQNSLLRSKEFKMIKYYIKYVPIRYRIFYYIISNEYYNLMIIYYIFIEGLKKLVK